MDVIRADAFGMCFGVRHALSAAERVAEPDAVWIHGELVHNQAVTNRLRERGFHVSSERERSSTVPVSPIVMLTAHGASQTERHRLEKAGKRLIDTTCPLVSRVHKAAARLESDGYHVLLAGRRGHTEVEGIVGDLHSYHVIETAADVTTYPYPRLGLIAQTTSTTTEFQQIESLVRDRNPQADIRVIDTVCKPTKDRQRALSDLLARVDAVVVVGGKHSNNTQKLVARCLSAGIPACHVEQASDLRRDWFNGYATVGLTAGTSTLDTTVDEVFQALQHMR